MGVAMAIYLTAGVSGAHLNPLLPLHCGCLPVSTSAKLFLFRFTSCRRFLRCGFSLRALLHLFFDFEQTHHIVRGSVESVIWLALSLLTRILISILCRLSS